MGEPTHPPYSAIACDGKFDSQGNWETDEDWVIEDGVAKCGFLGVLQWPVMLCEGGLEEGQTYHIEFDIIEGSWEDDDAFYVYVSFDPISYAGPFRWPGHYSIHLTCLEDDYDFRLRTQRGVFNDSNCIIDNLFVTNVATKTAYSEGFLPMAGTKHEVFSSVPTKATVRLAHWFDKSNCLIQRE